MNEKNLGQIELTSLEALEIAKYADTEETMFNAFEIAKYCENQFKNEIDAEWKRKRIYQTIYLAGIIDGVRKERTKRKDKMRQKASELENHVIDLKDGLKKLNLLNDDIIRDYFIYNENEKKKIENILYYYDNAAIKCDIVRDYIREIQTIANNIDRLTYSFLGISKRQHKNSAHL